MPTKKSFNKQVLIQNGCLTAVDFIRTNTYVRSVLTLLRCFDAPFDEHDRYHGGRNSGGC